MNIKEYFEKHNNHTLRDEEWEQVAQTLMNAKFDRQKKAEWASKLRAEGIYRTTHGTISLGSTKIRKFLAAASVLFLLAAAGWHFFGKSPLSSAQRLAGQYLEQPFRLNQGNTRGEDSIEKNRGKAYESFEMKQFEKSLNYLRIIESDGQAKAADFFQMGLCLMYQKEPDYAKAVQAFNAVKQSDPAAYSDEINWFSGLCLLMKGDEKAAANSLQKVVDSTSSRNRDAAIELLKKLKR